MHHMTHDNRETDLDKLALAQFIDKDGRFNDELCNVFRSGINNKSKISSYGFLATFLNCSVIVGFTEQPCSEGSECKDLICTSGGARIFRMLDPISGAWAPVHAYWEWYWSRVMHFYQVIFEIRLC